MDTDQLLSSIRDATVQVATPTPARSVNCSRLTPAFVSVVRGVELHRASGVAVRRRVVSLDQLVNSAPSSSSCRSTEPVAAAARAGDVPALLAEEFGPDRDARTSGVRPRD